ncbi:hypothetical protein N7456_007607 [Penicillium angulare]|uniref:DUF7600 domain-containing protein n=1 Tax=Penicillium angulare TaxID=116970 RepID=A0A9W9K8X2_9EURO|nr:hypothetical protein N7456_007607 [Penicillium angulare]
MSPRIYCCIICGYEICEDEEATPEGQWLKEFRAIYSNHHGCFLSGVGIYDDMHDQLRAPSDPSERYDDADYDPHLATVFHVKIYWEETRAFVSHDLCWKLLEKASQPKMIPLERFIEICESLPLPLEIDCFHWGHTYGGIYSFDTESSYPWQCQLVNQPSDLEAFRSATHNPYEIPEVKKLIAEPACEPVSSMIDYEHEFIDCFGKLPWEIRESIANNLATHDALNLRESSRSFFPLLASSTFWASRFQPGAERAFLFEKPNTAENRDWLSLYRQTSRKQSSPGLQNRMRIWHLIDHISQLLSLSLDEKWYEASSPFSDEHESTLVDATAEIAKPLASDGVDPNFQDGCRVSRRLYASIPHDLVAISFSFVDLEDYTYLTGLCFRSKNGRVVRIGYVSAHIELYEVEGLQCLSGFVLAIDPRGIRAVQVVHSNGDRSQWFGSSKFTPITERLAVLDTTKPIRVSVDIISIAATIPKDSRSSLAETSSSIRTKALWYPSVPGAEVCLNEGSFMEAIPLTMEYLPIHWVRFGGSQGSCFRRLIDVSMDTLIYSARIEFLYEEDGLCKRNSSRFGEFVDPDYIDMVSNPIHGPGGEEI